MSKVRKMRRAKRQESIRDGRRQIKKQIGTRKPIVRVETYARQVCNRLRKFLPEKPLFELVMWDKQRYPDGKYSGWLVDIVDQGEDSEIHLLDKAYKRWTFEARYVEKYRSLEKVNGETT